MKEQNIYRDKKVHTQDESNRGGVGYMMYLGSGANISLMLYVKKISFVCVCLYISCAFWLVFFPLGSFFLFSVATSVMST